LIKDENGDLLVVSHNILNRWKNYFSQLLNVHSVGAVRQREIHTAEQLVPEPSPFEVEIATAKFKIYATPGIDQIGAELIQARGETLQSEIHNLINYYIWNNDELPKKLESIIVPVYKQGDKADCSNYRGISLFSTSYKMLSSILSRLSLCVYEITGDHQCGFRLNRSTADQIFCIRQILEKWKYNDIGYMYRLFIDFKKTYDLVMRGVLSNILIEFGVPMKLVRLIKMSLLKPIVKSIQVNICLRRFC
jgi:hypothetical protein